MLTLRLMPWQLSVMRLPMGTPHEWASSGAFYTITQSPDELSVICETRLIPPGTVHSSGWEVIKVDAILDFSLVGIVAQLSSALAEAGISIFAISTYNTDYILVKAADTQQALETLRQTGYDILA